MRTSERAGRLRPFLAMEVMERAQALERAGERVIHLELGEPDFAPPPAAVEACRAALSRGDSRYTASVGLAELRVAIAADKSARTGVPLDPERVIVTSGTSPALLLVFGTLCDAGSEVIVPAPHYACYPNFARFVGATPIPVPCDPAAGWAIDPAAVRRALSPRTRAIVLGSPANPTGAIQSRDVLRALAELGVPLVSDEIYDGLAYDGARVCSALEVTDECFVLDGFSKRYAMTGFRLGYAIAPLGAMRALQTLQQNLFISASEFVQHAGIAALREGAGLVASARAAYARRRDQLVAGLRALGFGIAALPPGAFYVFADARAFGADSVALANLLLERARVAVTPGVDFGAAGEGFLRFCYAASEADIAEALRRLAPVLRSLRGDAG